MSHLQTLVVFGLSVIFGADVRGGETPQPRADNIAPRYPGEMYRQRLEGHVVLQLHLADDGSVEKVTVHKSSGHEAFDRSARDAAKEWRFDLRDPQSEREFYCPVKFRLANDKPTVESPQLEWKQLAELNDPHGFAGQFVGVSRDRLLLYGGTNFPGKKVWEGGTKAWYRDVFVLDDLGAKWRKLGPLPDERAVGYGVNVPYEQDFLCIGGADAARHYADVFALGCDGDKMTTRDLPPLPRPCAYACGARIGDVIYVAGGIETPDAVRTMRTFWSLDLQNLAAGWQELTAWPGPPRMLALAAVHEGAFYLMSGVDLFPDANGKPMRIYLRDAYRYAPNEGWTRLADPPRAIVAAPSPAMTVGDELVVFGGDHGRNLGFKPPQDHPGFPRDLFAYEVRTNRWRPLGEQPYPIAVTPLVEWKGGYVAASGELRPAVRSTATWWVRRGE